MKKLLITTCIILMSGILEAQVTKNVNCTNPGTLNTLITGTEVTTITNLTVTGYLDARDIYFMRDSMSVLAVLDLYDAQIKAYNNYQDNQLPDASFYNKISLTSINLPNNLIYLGDSAFYNCSGLVCNLSIPNSVTSIGKYTFYNCSFTGSLLVGNSVLSIGKGAFGYCTGFTGSLIIGNSVTSIGAAAFYSCDGFTGSLTIPNSVTTIGYSAFEYCSGFTGSLTISNSITSIEHSTFSNCGFTGELVIPNSVTSIGFFAFGNCKGFTGSLTIPNSVISIGGQAFHYCEGFTGDLTISNSVKLIDRETFIYCNGFKGKLTLPDSLTSIKNSAFWGCGFTGKLTIPNSVTSIGSGAFGYCNFDSIVRLTEPLPVTQDIFNGIDKTVCVLVVPVGSKKLYQAAYCWKDFTHIIEYGTTIFVVSFNSLGGSEVGNIFVDSNSVIAEPIKPTKIGYTFSGWYKEDACVNDWDFATEVVKTDITLFAKWELITVAEKKQITDFKIYPNPAKDKLYTNFNLPNTSVAIFDLQGKRVTEILTSETQIDISNLLNGVYLVKIFTPENIIVYKLIKE